MDALIATENGIACARGPVLGTVLCTVVIVTDMHQNKLGVLRVGEND